MSLFFLVQVVFFEAMAHRRGVSPKQMVDRWWLQLGGLLFVEGHIEERVASV